jgi:hypothetical protein
VVTGPAWWARLAVRLATLPLPAGQARARYRRELECEQWGTSHREQAAHARGILSQAWALRSAVIGDPVVRHSTLWCRAHLHHEWRRAVTDDGGRYRHCVACGLDDDGTVNQSFDGWYGANSRLDR